MDLASARRLTTVSTLLGAALSLLSALSMRDHVRLVEIVTLFFGGVGTGAGIVSLMVERKRSRARSSEPAS